VAVRFGSYARFLLPIWRHGQASRHRAFDSAGPGPAQLRRRPQRVANHAFSAASAFIAFRNPPRKKQYVLELNGLSPLGGIWIASLAWFGWQAYLFKRKSTIASRETERSEAS
jgi:hypothetical protein